MTVRRAEPLAAALLTALLAGFHIFFLLRAGGLWRDEAALLNLARGTSAEAVRAGLKWEPSFPLLFPFVLRGWTALDPARADEGLRLLGCLIGLLVIAAQWLGARLEGRSSPILSLTLFGLNPLALRTTDALRAYGLGVVLVLAASALIHRAAVSPTPRRLGLAAVAAVLSVQCLYQNAVLLSAVCFAASVVALLDGRRRVAGAMAGIWGLTVLSILPYLGAAAPAREAKALIRVPMSLGSIWSGFSEVLSSPAGAMLLVWIALAVLGAAAGIRRRTGDALFFLLALAAAVPAYFAFICFLGINAAFWHFVPLLAVAAFCLEGLLMSPAAGAANSVKAFLAALLAAVLLVPSFHGIGVRQTNIDIIARGLEQSAAPDDLILVNPWYCGTSFQRYYHGRAPWMSVPPLEDHALQRWDLLKARMSSDHPIRPVLDGVKRTLASGHRVWIVWSPPHQRAGPKFPPLPPAPGAPSGWYSGPYLIQWWAQVGDYVRTHAGGVSHHPPVHEGPVNPYEDMRLSSAQGWRP